MLRPGDSRAVLISGMLQPGRFAAFALREPLLTRSLAKPSNPRDILLVGRPPARTQKTMIFSSRRPRLRVMARSKTDLPRMQNPARSRTPVELGLKVAPQPVGRVEKPKNPA